MKLGIHCYVSGKVQGVWFRAATKAEAERLGLTGWVRNLPDGRVEVMAYGSEAPLTGLRDWLHLGPPRAKVIEVVCEEVSWQEYEGFKVV